MAMIRIVICSSLTLAVLLVGGPAAGQMVSATTGAINGNIVDEVGKPLADVTVTIFSPSLMGLRTARTNTDGRYRFPALPPGSYKVAGQREGYSTVIFDGVRVTLGFTATVNMGLKTKVAETQTVSDRGPIVDRLSTRTSTEFDAAKLAAQPSARNMWAILEQTPAVRMSTIDVGGSRAGSQSGYTTYDAKGGQARVTLDGIVTTEGTGSIGVYFDYGAVAESSTGTASQGADMGWPGVQSLYIAKAGGAEYHGSVYVDYENERIQSRNVDAALIQRGAAGGEANRLHAWSVFNGDVGGYLPRLRERGWWYFGFRRNDIQARLVDFPKRPQQTVLYNYSGKTTFQLSKNNKIIGYAQRVLKYQPYRLASARASRAIYLDESATTSQRHWSWAYKGEWNRVLNDTMFFEVRGGQFGYDWPLKPNGSEARVEDLATGIVQGATRDWFQVRRRNQVLWSLTIFRDNWGGAHTVKLGGDFFREGYEETWHKGWGSNDSVSLLNNGAPVEVRLYETPSTSLARLNTTSAYAADIWQVNNRLTISPSVRFDRYRGFLPEQTHSAGLWNAVAQTFPAVDKVISWNLFAPRVGATYDIRGNGRTVLKGFFGRYWWNPGTDFMFTLHANSVSWYRDYQWTNDANGNRLWDPGEEGRLLATQGGRATERFDPNVVDTYTDEATAWLERELFPNFSLRAGLIYRAVRNNRQRLNANRPFSAYNVPVSLQDPGADGVIGSTDDGKAIQAYNLDPALLALLPDNLTRNVPDEYDYYNLEITANRRFTRGWSLLATWAKRWNQDNGPSNIRQNTNVLTPNDLINTEGDGRFHYTYSTWKLQATYDGPWGFRVSPVLRSVSGQPWGRTFQARMNYGTITVLAEPLGARRQDNLTFFDARVEKRFPVRALRNARLGILIDFYNLLNANPVEAMNWSSGSSFMRPTTIPGPRIVRLGAKFDW
jgi:hypothetical protein